jgi:hypothetical protein
MLDGRASPSSPAFLACMLQMPITFFPLVPTPKSAIEIAKASAGLATAVIRGFLKLNSHFFNTKIIHYDLYFFGKFGAGVAILQL